MSPLERRGWQSAAVDALGLRITTGGAAAGRLLVALAANGGRLTLSAARTACQTSLPGRDLPSREAVRVSVSHLRGALRDVGFADAVKADGSGGYLIGLDRLREIDAFVRSYA